MFDIVYYHTAPDTAMAPDLFIDQRRPDRTRFLAEAIARFQESPHPPVHDR
jgi:hypothetical protein